MESEDDIIDDLTVALHLDSIKYDTNTLEYEIQLSSVKLIHLDIDKDLVRLRIPSHRLRRIKSALHNAEPLDCPSNSIPSITKLNSNTAKLSYKRRSSASPQSDLSQFELSPDPNLDDIVFTKNGDGLDLEESDRSDQEQPADSIADHSDDDEDEKRSFDKEVVTPQIMQPVEVAPLRRQEVVSEWSDILREHRSDSSNRADEAVIVSKGGSFARICFVLKMYSRWMLYNDKHFQSQKMTKDDFTSMTSLLDVLEGYDKIKLLNDYFWILDNQLLKEHPSDVVSVKRKDIMHCAYIFNRHNNRSSELYNSSKLSDSLRRDLYFIHDQNEEIQSGSVAERVEIGIQQYLDVVYCAMMNPNNVSDGNKFSMKISVDDVVSKNEDSVNSEDDDVKVSKPQPDGLGVEMKQSCVYMTYWDSTHSLYSKAKWPDLKTELLSNAIRKIDVKDFYVLYNRAKDILLSNIGRRLVAKRTKPHCKVKMDQKLTIGHLIAILLYANYFNDFVGTAFIEKGCMKVTDDEEFSSVLSRNQEIAVFCRLLNEVVFIWGNMASAESRFYYNLTRRVSLRYLSLERNIPISTTSSFAVSRRFHQQKHRSQGTSNGMILRLGKFQSAKEYNYVLPLSNYSNYPMEREQLIYGGKFEINDIIYDNKLHHGDVQSIKLYLQIMKGRWFSHNKLLFKKQYEKRLISMITVFLNDGAQSSGACDDLYIQSLFNNIVVSNGTTRSQKIIYLNRECDKLLPELKTILTKKLCPLLCSNKMSKVLSNGVKFRRGYNTVLIMKLNYESIRNSCFNKSMYSTPYKYQLLYLKNNRPQEIVLHFRCYRKIDEKSGKTWFKGCFELKHLPSCVSKCRLICGLLLPQIGFEKWDSVQLGPTKLYSGSSLFELNKIKPFDSVMIKIAFQIKEVLDQDEKLIPTIDL